MDLFIAVKVKKEDDDDLPPPAKGYMAGKFKKVHLIVTLLLHAFCASN